MNRALGVLLVVVLVGAAIGPAAGVGATQIATSATGPTETRALQEGTPTPSANETRHVDPDETNENGNLLGLQSALASRMAERLAGSSIQLSQGQYDLANQLISQEFQDQYGKYVDVAGDTDREDSAPTFDEARERQETFNDNVQTYQETVDEYEEAREDGNTREARRLARDLERLSENVSRTGTRVRQSYTAIGNQTGADMSEGSRAVNQTVANVTAQQEEIRTLLFEATSLTVSARSQTASFADPQVIDGRLTTENGSAIANRTVVVRVAERRETVETNATGAFTLEYRPVTTQTGQTDVTVRYVPNETSVYLGSRANASFVVEQVDSTVSVERLTPRATFGTPVEVSGSVTAADRGVPGVPVVVSVGGTRIARGTTTVDGAFTLSGQLPASVPVGEQTVRVRVPLDGRAIAGSNATREFNVTETATSLTLETETTASTISLAGEFTTRTGEGIAGQQLEIRRNGSLVATTQTRPDGRYEETVPGDAEERYRVTVRYEEPTTNLENASASAVVTLPASGSGSDSNGGGDGTGGVASFAAAVSELLADNPLLAALGGLLGLALLSGLGWWFLGRTDADDAGAGTPTETASTPPAVGEEPATTESASTRQPNPLDSAWASIEEDTDAAVEQAYSATRGLLRAEDIASPDATHWEFYRACVDAGLEGTDALETLTSLYERAAFGPSSVSRGDAETALSQADRFV